MPVYTYRRQDGTTFDIKQSFSDDPLTTCPTTGQPVKRVIQNPGVIFKGSGFYVNDNKKAANPANGNHKSETKAESNGSDKADTKSETESKKPKETAPAPSND